MDWGAISSSSSAAMSRDAAAVDSTVPPMVKKAVMRGGTGANMPNKKKSRTTADGEEVFFSVGVGVTELTVGSVFASVLDVTVFSNIHNTSAWWCVAKLLCSTNQATISWIIRYYNNQLSNNTSLPAFRIIACYCLSKRERKTVATNQRPSFFRVSGVDRVSHTNKSQVTPNHQRPNYTHYCHILRWRGKNETWKERIKRTYHLVVSRTRRGRPSWPRAPRRW